MSTMKIFTFFTFLLLVGITEYAIASTPQVRDETSDWKTYRNEQYGFEVEYPAQMNVEENPSYLLRGGPMDSKFNVSFFNPNKSYPEEHPFEFYATVYTNEERLSPQQWFTSKEFPSNLGGDKYKTINDVTAVDFGPEGAGGRTIYFFGGTRIVALVNGDMPADSFQIIVSDFQLLPLENQPPISNTESKESVVNTIPGGISPPIFRGLQWLATLLIIGAFIFKFKPHIFKVIFSIIFAAMSLILLNSCFITDVSLPKFCDYRMLSFPVFIFADPLGDIIRTVATRNLIMPIATPLIVSGVWYIIGSALFALYNRILKK